MISDSLSIDRRNLLLAGVTLAAGAGITPPASEAHAAGLNPQPLPPSPDWARALPPGPDVRVKITEA